MSSHLSVAVKPQYFRGTSLQSRMLGTGLRHTVRPLLGAWAHLPFDVFPPNLIDAAARLLPVPEGTMWRRVDLEDCSAELLQAKGVADVHGGNDKVVLYFHGGAFLTCGLNTHRRLVSRISHASGQPVLNVGYCQMPDQPIAHTIEDCVDGFRWLLDQGYRPENITIAGDSAGGFLAFSVTRAVIDRGWGRPAGVVAISPLLDFDPTRKQNHPNAHTCDTFPLHAVARLNDVADRIDARSKAVKRVSPVDMPLTDMPPALIHIGSTEVLMADAELMCNRLVAAGVPCDLQVWERQVHVFHAAASWVPEARIAITEIGEFIRRLDHTAVRTTSPAVTHPSQRGGARATHPASGLR